METDYPKAINDLFIHLIGGEYPHNTRQFVLFHDKNDKALVELVLKIRCENYPTAEPLHVFSYTNEYGAEISQIWFLKEWNEHKESVEKYTRQRAEKLDKEREHSHRHDKTYQLLCKVYGIAPFSKAAEEKNLGKQSMEFNNRGKEFLNTFFAVFVMAGVVTQTEVDNLIDDNK